MDVCLMYILLHHASQSPFLLLPSNHQLMVWAGNVIIYHSFAICAAYLINLIRTTFLFCLFAFLLSRHEFFYQLLDETFHTFAFISP